MTTSRIEAHVQANIRRSELKRLLYWGLSKHFSRNEVITRVKLLQTVDPDEGLYADVLALLTAPGMKHGERYRTALTRLALEQLRV